MKKYIAMVRYAGALMLLQGTGLALLAQDPVQIQFKFSTYAVVESATYVAVELSAFSGSSQPDPITVQYATHDGTAKAGQDYVATSGELVITPNESNNLFYVEILNDAVFEGTESFQVSLSGPTGNAVLDGITNALVEIVDDESYQPGALDAAFDTSDGPDAVVHAVAPTHNGKVLVGGAFTNVNGLTRPALARLGEDGVAEAAFQSPFEPGTVVYAVLQQSDGKVLAGGSLLVGGVARQLVRLEANGDLDSDFSPPAFDGPVYALASSGNEKTLVGGSFAAGAGNAQSNLVCVLHNGSLDPTFTTAISGAVRAILVQPDGRVLIAGGFRFVADVMRTFVARLLDNGSLDIDFASVGAGALHGTTGYGLALQNDGKVLFSGDFDIWDGRGCGGIRRLSTDGTVDYSYEVAVPGGNVIRSLAMQPNSRVIAGGDFPGLNNIPSPGSYRPRQGLARITTDAFPDPTFDPEGASPMDVRTVVLQMQDMKVLVAGDFTTFNSQPRKRICRLHGDIRTRITGVEVINQVVSLTVTNEAQRTYVLERSDPGSNWVPVATNVAAAQQSTFTSLMNPGQRSVFFRIKEVNP